MRKSTMFDFYPPHADLTLCSILGVVLTGYSFRHLLPLEFSLGLSIDFFPDRSVAPGPPGIFSGPVPPSCDIDGTHRYDSLPSPSPAPAVMDDIPLHSALSSISVEYWTRTIQEISYGLFSRSHMSYDAVRPILASQPDFFGLGGEESTHLG
ncbi:hypothetical protein DFH06DRAFT_1340012 [Mycena polygramma]|nr:hypothetical protein DFH06DRAFT_1340012 [Mycena polygramma]